MLTIIDDTYEGTIFSYDPLTSTLALTQASTAPAHDFRILKISFLKDVTVLGGGGSGSGAPPRARSTTPFASAEPRIGVVALAGLVGREKDVARNESDRVASRGIGVSRDGQDIFDALARMWATLYPLPVIPPSLP